MPRKKQPKVWSAEQHTLAKIAMLSDYLQRWFQIFGIASKGENLVYIDGFAGPGEYTNSPHGSPLKAVIAAKTARADSRTSWNAGVIHCVFIEADEERFEHLSERMKPFSGTPEVQIHLVHDQFANGMIRLKDQMPDLFQQTCPKFFFIDPFGAKGVPFATVSDILSNRFTEVLINLDADGIARILRANTSAVYERLLTEIFGDDSWRKISRSSSFSQQCREVLNLYKGNLRKHAQYIFSFEMKTSESALNYFLVFASQHPRGLEKMKEAMKKIDQDGSYRFSDTSVGQTIMFRGDDSNLFSKAMKMHFAGRKVSFEELRDFALNETPFLNPKQMLKQLEADGFITVESSDQRRKGTFNEAKIRSIEFRPET